MNPVDLALAGVPFRRAAKLTGLSLGQVAGRVKRFKDRAKTEIRGGYSTRGRLSYDESNLTETWAARKARLAAERARA